MPPAAFPSKEPSGITIPSMGSELLSTVVLSAKVSVLLSVGTEEYTDDESSSGSEDAFLLFVHPERVIVKSNTADNRHEALWQYECIFLV